MTDILLLIVRLLMAAALYVFFGWALYVLWQDLRLHGLNPVHNKIPLLTLYSDQNTEAGHENTYQFNFPEVIVGRSSAVDCVIETETISVRHARMYYRQNQWWVEDLKSTNGTRLNHEKVLIPTILTTGDILVFGDQEFIVAIAQMS